MTDDKAALGGVDERAAEQLRSWPEDFEHDNGNYMCNCIKCKQRFFGHKRRIVCKVCDTPRSNTEVADALKWLRSYIEETPTKHFGLSNIADVLIRQHIRATQAEALLPAQRGEGGVDLLPCHECNGTGLIGMKVGARHQCNLCEGEGKFRDRRAAIAALARSTEGWVSVPKKPTPEQVNAGWHEISLMLDSGDFALITKAVYRAMLAAAPAEQPQGPEKRE